jgi:hypothetical protein
MKKKFVICVENSNVEASLERWKVYQTLEDQNAKDKNMIRVVDESGEDYLFPAQFFAPIELPETVEQAISHATK